MGTRKTRDLVLAGLTALLLFGCAGTDNNQDASDTDDDAPGMEAPDTDRSTAPTPQPEREQMRIGRGSDGKNVAIVPLPDGGSEELQGLFYFDFDQAIVKRQGHAELNKHADVLKANPRARMRLEGHADERGTREYNLALGERRANAIRGYLTRQGVNRSQIEVVSFGEEKPISAGKGERSYALNRRVEIVYR